MAWRGARAWQRSLDAPLPLPSPLLPLPPAHSRASFVCDRIARCASCFRLFLLCVELTSLASASIHPPRLRLSRSSLAQLSRVAVAAAPPSGWFPTPRRPSAPRPMDPAEPTPDPTSNRWGNRTPSPDFVKRAVSPLSPAQVAQPPTTAVMSDLNVPGHIPPETLPYVPAWSSARQCASSTAVLPPPSHRDDGYRLLPALSTLPPETQPVPSGGLDILALLCDTQPKLPVPSSTDVQPVLVPTEGQGSLHQESTNREADEPNHPVTAQSVGDEMAPSYANTAFTHQYVRPGSSGPVDMPAADEAIHQDQPLNPPFSSPISLWSLHNQSRKRSGTQIVIEDVDSLLPKRQRMSSQDSLSHHSPENAQAHGVSDLSIAPTTSSPPPFLNNVTQFTDKAVIISRRKTQSDIRVPVFPTSSRQRRHTSSSASMTNGKPPVPLSWDMKSPTFMPMPVSESAIEDTNPGSFTEAGPRRLSLDGTAAGAGIKQLRPSPLLEATILGTEQSFNDDASKNPVTNAKKRPAPRNGGTSKRKRTKPTSGISFLLDLFYQNF